MGVALGMTWTFVVGIAYRQRAMRSFSGVAASLIFFGMLAITFSWQVDQNLEGDLVALKLPFQSFRVHKALQRYRDDRRLQSLGL